MRGLRPPGFRGLAWLVLSGPEDMQKPKSGTGRGVGFSPHAPPEETYRNTAAARSAAARGVSAAAPQPREHREHESEFARVAVYKKRGRALWPLS